MIITLTSMLPSSWPAKPPHQLLHRRASCKLACPLLHRSLPCRRALVARAASAPAAAATYSVVKAARALGAVPAAPSALQKRVLLASYPEGNEGLLQLLMALHLATVEKHKVSGSQTLSVLKSNPQYGSLAQHYSRGEDIHEVLRSSPVFRLYTVDKGLWVQLDLRHLWLPLKALKAPVAASPGAAPPGGSLSSSRGDGGGDGGGGSSTASLLTWQKWAVYPDKPDNPDEYVRSFVDTQQRVDALAGELVPNSAGHTHGSMLRELAAFLASMTRNGPHGAFTALKSAAILHLSRMKQLGQLDADYTKGGISEAVKASGSPLTIERPADFDITVSTNLRLLRLAVPILPSGSLVAKAEVLGHLFTLREELRLLAHPTGRLVQYAARGCPDGDTLLHTLVARHLALTPGHTCLGKALRAQLCAYPEFDASGLSGRYTGSLTLLEALEPNPVFRTEQSDGEATPHVALDLQELSKLANSVEGQQLDGSIDAAPAAAPAAGDGSGPAPPPRLFTQPGRTSAAGQAPFAAAAATDAAATAGQQPAQPAPLRKQYVLSLPRLDMPPAFLLLDGSGGGDSDGDVMLHQQVAEASASVANTAAQQQEQQEQASSLLRLLPPMLRPSLEPFLAAARPPAGGSHTTSPGAADSSSGFAEGGSGLAPLAPLLTEVVIDHGRPVVLHVAPSGPALQPTRIVLPGVQVCYIGGVGVSASEQG